MPFYLSLLFVPAVLLAASWWDDRRRWTWFEVLVYLGLNLGIASFACSVVFESNIADHEIRSGLVHGKRREDVSCSHAYDCNCREECSEDSSGHESCGEVCDTCYEHDFDRVWTVLTTAGPTEIDTVDSQGLLEPEAWTHARPGQPAAVRHRFRNYVKGAGLGFFAEAEDFPQYQGQLPPYPDAIVRGYRVARLVEVGGALPSEEVQAWNQDLMRLNARLGPKREVNVVVVLVRDHPSDFARALARHWLRGKKNDCIVVVGVEAGPLAAQRPRWVEVLAWALDRDFEGQLAAEVAALDALERPAVLTTIERFVDQNFSRKPMADFAYLAELVKPTWGQWLGCMFLCGVVSTVAAFFFIENDVRRPR